jgi:fibronectin-binding autotransporter adhesin
MISPTYPRRRTLLATATLAALAVLGFNTSPTQAADRFWTGGGGGTFDWMDAANWDGPIAEGDSLFFTGAVGTANNNNFANGTAFNGITFSDTAFTLDGNDVLLSGNFAGVASGVTNLSVTDSQTVNLNLSLDWGLHSFNGGVGLALNGTITHGLASTVNFESTGIITSTSLTQDANNGLITGLGAAAVIRTGNAIDGLATIDTGTNTIRLYDYATDPGGMELAYGTEISGTTENTNLNLTGNGTSTLAAGDQLIGSIRGSAADANGVITLADGQVLRFGTVGSVIYTGAQNNGGRFTVGGIGSLSAGGAVTNTPGTLIFNGNGTSTNNQIDILADVSIIDNGETGAVTVVKTGNGSMVLRGASTYSGGTYINEGYLQVNNATGLGSGPVFISGNNATLTFQNAGAVTVANDITLAPGVGYTVQNNGALKVASAIDLAGTLTLTGTPIETPDATSAGNRISNTSGSAAAMISGQITGTGTLELRGNGGTTNVTTAIVLANPIPNGNDWNGGLIVSQNTVTHSMTVRLGAADQIPDGAGKGNVTLNQNTGGDTSRVALDLNGFNETINGLTSVRPEGVTGQMLVLNDSPNTTSTLTLGGGNAAGTFGGSIQNGTVIVLPEDVPGIVALTKTGTGAQVLSGVNTYTGATAINGGTLTLDATGALAGTTNVDVTVGTLVLQNSSSLNDALTLSLVTGTTLNLDFIGAEQIFALTLNGSDIAMGVYTAPQLSILDPSIDFMGTGSLAVIPEPGVVALAIVGICVVLLNARRRRVV